MQIKKNFYLLGFLGLTLSTLGVAKEYIVKAKPSLFVSLQQRLESKSISSLKVLDIHEAGSLIKVDISKADAAKTLAELMKQSDVEYVVENVKVQAFESPADLKALREQWALKKVNAEKAWQLAGNRGSEKIVVAVIDTGVDYNHESLKANAVAGYDFIKNNEDPMDITGSQNPGHGTHCAGIVGATGDVENGTSGISQKVAIMPIRFLDQNGSGDLMNGVKAIDFAISKKVRVISASWGARIGRSQAKPVIEAVERADAAGIVFVAAAANDGKNNDTTEMYPANVNSKNMITVAASGPNDEKPSWSNYGRKMVSLAAPGLDIMSTLPKNKYSNLSGTSMATPLVSGLVALLLAQNENLNGMELRSLLQITGAGVQIETQCNCRVDAGAAMETLLNKTPFIAPAAKTIAPKETLQLSVVHAKAPFTFTSTNPSVLTVDANGLVTAMAKGDARVTAVDSVGAKATTLDLRVVEAGSGGGGGGGDDGGGGAPGQCPLPDPDLCDQICQISPNLPWCKQ